MVELKNVKWYHLRSEQCRGDVLHYFRVYVKGTEIEAHVIHRAECDGGTWAVEWSYNDKAYLVELGAGPLKGYCIPALVIAFYTVQMEV